MAVADKPLESSMSSEAMDLITCYYDGVDDVVRDLAEQVAFKQDSFLNDGSGMVAVEIEHVQEAGRLVTEALRELVSAGKVPPALSQSIDQMENCVSKRLSKEKC